MLSIQGVSYSTYLYELKEQRNARYKVGIFGKSEVRLTVRVFEFSCPARAWHLADVVGQENKDCPCTQQIDPPSE